MRHPRTILRLEQLEARELLDASAFPNTQNGIFLLSDQLNEGLSNPLVQFISSHFVGTQKMLPSENARYLADNPNWVLLNYRLGASSGPLEYIHNGDWTSDWSDVTSHEDWFMHDPLGDRLHNSQFNWDLNDISNPDFRNYWVNSVINDMRINGAQGVFADSFTAGIGDFWFDQSDPRFAGTNAADPTAWPNGYTWVQQQQDFINYIEQALAATPEKFVYLPNLDAMVTGWYNLDTSNLDGAFLEDFGDWGPYYLNGSPDDWVLSMDRALPMSDAGKILIMQPYLYNDPNSDLGLTQRGFDLGTYLLLKGDHTYLNLPTPGDSPSGAYYYPEDTLNLGPAVTPLASDVSQYQWNGVYRRDFQSGIVLVNPSNTDVTIDMGQVYQQVSFSGGGAVSDSSFDANGNYTDGSLSQTPAQVVTVAAGGAVFLLNSTPDSSGPNSPAALAAPTPSAGLRAPSGLTTATDSGGTSGTIGLSPNAAAGTSNDALQLSLDTTYWASAASALKGAPSGNQARAAGDVGNGTTTANGGAFSETSTGFRARPLSLSLSAIDATGERSPDGSANGGKS